MCITDDQANKDVNSFQEAEKRKSDRDNEVEAERKEEVSLDTHATACYGRRRSAQVL